MHGRGAITFLAAVGISLAAAAYRWGDTAHSIGLITPRGGVVRHAPRFPPGPGRYTLIASLNVLPPYRGDARVGLEGEPPLDHEFHISRPALDLGLRDAARLEEGVLRGLQPRDSVTLWAVLRRRGCDPVCGMAFEERFERHDYRGQEFRFCSPGCWETFSRDPERFADAAAAGGPYRLTVRDAATDQLLVGIPVSFGQQGGGADDPAAHAH